MPVRSFGASFLRATRGSVSSRIGQSVGQRATKDHLGRPFAQVRGGGQGRGRTADLPIFRTTVIRSYSIATVHDVRRKIHPVIDERRRTKPNETEKETTRA